MNTNFTYENLQVGEKEKERFFIFLASKFLPLKFVRLL